MSGAALETAGRCGAAVPHGSEMLKRNVAQNLMLALALGTFAILAQAQIIAIGRGHAGWR